MARIRALALSWAEPNKQCTITLCLIAAVKQRRTVEFLCRENGLQVCESALGAYKAPKNHTGENMRIIINIKGHGVEPALQCPAHSRVINTQKPPVTKDSHLLYVGDASFCHILQQKMEIKL